MPRNPQGTPIRAEQTGMLNQADFADLVRAGGCVYGNQPRQGKQLCRGAVEPGGPWCLRHKHIVLVETDPKQRELNERTERAVIAVRNNDRRMLESVTEMERKIA